MLKAEKRLEVKTDLSHARTGVNIFLQHLVQFVVTSWRTQELRRPREEFLFFASVIF